MLNAIEAAREYKRRGWNPLPLRPGEKRPSGQEWQRTIIADADIETAFRGMNIGVALGTSSGGLYDADLDDDLVVKMQRHFMPRTPAIFGRTSKPGSHLLYQAMPGEEIQRKQFIDADGTLLAELRMNGHQTMFPPSLHPSGEPVTWQDPQAVPAQVPLATATLALGWACSAVMIVRGWDSWADRHHNLTLALAGGLGRSGISLQNAENFVRAVGIYSGDHEIDDRVRTVRDTYAKLDENANESSVTGFPTLQEIIGFDRVKRLLAWLPLTKPDGTTRLSLSDDGNALRFVDTYEASLRYVHEWGEWLQWDGSRWARDKRENVIALAREIPHQIGVQAQDILDDDERKVVEKWANASRNVNRLLAIPRIARTDERLKVAADLLDADPYAFNVQNGTINLRTGGIGPHSSADLITKLSAITYNVRAECPRWLAYLDLVFGADPVLIEFVQRCVGYSLTGSTREQVFFIANGPQGTGKTTFIETIRAMFDEYAHNSDPGTFMQKAKSGRATPEIAQLQGARFVTSSETEENEKLAASLVKRLSGNTRISASHLYAAPFEFDPIMKLWIDTNFKPKINAHDDAVWARLVLVPFEKEIRGTRLDIKDYKLVLRTELPGILRWAVEGCQNWQHHGLARPEKIAKASESYRTESDALLHFVEEFCLSGPDEECGARELYAAYKRWCDESSERPATSALFKTNLQGHGYRFNPNTNKGARWCGLRPASTPGSSEAAPLNRLDGQSNPFDVTRPHA